jgi:hypothetical protein
LTSLVDELDFLLGLLGDRLAGDLGDPAPVHFDYAQDSCANRFEFFGLYGVVHLAEFLLGHAGPSW